MSKIISKFILGEIVRWKSLKIRNRALIVLNSIKYNPSIKNDINIDRYDHAYDMMEAPKKITIKIKKPTLVDKFGGFINKVSLMDCIDGMSRLPDEIADVIICDPPYNIGKDFGNDSDKQKIGDYLQWCDQWISQCFRILKPRGTMYIYGLSETLAFIRTRINQPWNVRWLVWHYTNKTVPSLNFWQRSHESILCCFKEKPCFNRDDVREPYTEGFLNNSAGKKRSATKGRFSNGEKETTYTAHENGALPRDVIKISTLAGGSGVNERVDHPAQKPISLCQRLIKASANNEIGRNLIISPFAGSGSECVAAKNLGHDFIGFEINDAYIKLCQERLEAKTAQD